ncbi:MAG: hotdog fold thioesterase [Chitinophagaceae bacterium]|nr:MAG: hotdog fold thioesterase [Chitinophagaceae bacterium]
MIWFNKALTLSDVEDIMPNTMADFLEMEWVAIGPDYLRLRMPVIAKTKQPYGLLHGGASCALAETVGSIGSALVVDRSVNICVGLEINANHIRSATSGFVTATARPVHLGKSTHVWDIRLEDDEQKLVCISRLTVAILPKK